MLGSFYQRQRPFNYNSGFGNSRPPGFVLNLAGGGSSSGGNTQQPTHKDIAGAPYTPLQLTGGRNSADTMNAALTRRQYQEYLDHYAPYEQDILMDLRRRRETIGRQADAAAQRAGAAFDTGSQISDRDLTRYRASLRPGQREALMKLREHHRGSNEVLANSLARRSIYDSILLQQSQISDAGARLSGMAQNTAGTLLNMETQRNATNRQIQAANRASRWRAIGSIGMMALGFGFGFGF